MIHRACESVRAGMAPDEFILITALRAHGFVRSIQRVEVKPGMSYPPGCLLNSYPTLVLFPEESSPHPVLWTNFEESISCQVSLCCQGYTCIAFLSSWHAAAAVVVSKYA